MTWDAGTALAEERTRTEQRLAALIEQARHHLAEIGAAGERLAAGGYGRCEVCGEPIAPGRLEARPVARTCIRCA